MKRVIKANQFNSEIETKYPWGSSKRKAKVQECADKLSRKYPDAIVQPIRSTIYVISPEVGVDMYVVDDWGHCGIIYGGFFDHVQDYLKDGGDIDLVTFTDKAGNVYTPYKNRKSINVTFPNGSSVDMNRGNAETLYLTAKPKDNSSIDSADDVIKADKYIRNGKGFSYILKHGLGPGTLPKDVEIIDHTEDGYKDIVWLNRRLNADELKYYDIKPYGVAINVMEARRDYGGAYDIDPYSYFTKDDLMEFAYELVDKIGETTGVRTDVSDIYLDDDDRIVVELDCNGVTSQQVFRFDMRRIRKPSDLKKYITPKFIKSFIDDFHDIGEIDDDVYERINQDLDK